MIKKAYYESLILNEFFAPRNVLIEESSMLANEDDLRSFDFENINFLNYKVSNLIGIEGPYL